MASCETGHRPATTWNLEVMGTVVSFTVVSAADAPEAASALRAAAELLSEVDRRFSIWDPWSPMSRLRRGAVTLADMAAADGAAIGAVLDRCRELVEQSDGWFDPWAVPGGVDPTGFVKGWAVQLAADVLAEAGVVALVNGGGDIATSGVPADGEGWRVGIRHPWRSDGLAAIVALDPPQATVATSGAYERGRHLVDPRTGQRTRGAVASATVVGADLGATDAFATAAAVGGRDAVAAITARTTGYELYLIDHDGGEWWTRRFPFVDDGQPPAELAPTGDR
jgi:thiamine biosynthesis lipoprotein